MNNYWEKVADYSATLASFGTWEKEDIIYELTRCRDDGESFLEKMSDADFLEFARDVANYYTTNFKEV